MVRRWLYDLADLEEALGDRRAALTSTEAAVALEEPPDLARAAELIEIRRAAVRT